MKGTILNVDDTEANRYAKTRLLRAVGFEVAEAGTGAAALDLAFARPPDLVLLDVRLPDISGIEVCRRLRADPRTARVPVIHISATQLMPADEARSLDAGADLYLAEPVSPRQLSSAVQAMLRLRASEQGLEAALAQAREGQRLAEEAVRTKDEFLAVLSHELRTPMSAMLGWLAVLKTATLPPEQQRSAIETIERNARLQNRLVNDLLDVSRIVAGKMELETEAVSLEVVLRQAMNSARPEAAARKVALVSSEAPGPWTLRGNPQRLQQVFGNLLSNAIKFSPEGGTVRVALERGAGGGASVTFADDGEGIAPELIAAVFDRFRQADSSSRRRHGGLGLGLPIARSLAQLHGGNVTAASEGVGRGATFAVELPLAAGAELRAGVPAPEPDAAANLEGLNILVVDDDRSNLDMIAHMLKMHGAEVRAAGDASSAVAIAGQWQPQVLVLDIGMPEKDGYELLPELRAALGRDAAALPAVALTGFAAPSDSARAAQAGFQAHVAKPFDMARLVALLARMARHPEGASP